MALTNKCALVTGGVGAIGASISLELLENGLKVLAVVDTSAEDPEILSEWRMKYPKAAIKYFPVDVTVREQLEECYSKLVKEIGSLDIVVNCAGIFNENLPKKVVEVNLIGVIQSTLIALEYMRSDKGKGNGGVILNIASIAGINPLSCAPTYSATKQAVIAFTRALAHDRDYLGIKFLTLCPGGTHSNLFGEIRQTSYLCSEELIKRMKDTFVFQAPEAVAKASVKQILEGESGSVWIIKGSEIIIPDLPSMRV